MSLLARFWFLFHPCGGDVIMEKHGVVRGEEEAPPDKRAVDAARERGRDLTGRLTAEAAKAPPPPSGRVTTKGSDSRE